MRRVKVLPNPSSSSCRRLSPPQPPTARKITGLGILYRDQGRLKEAESMYRRALEGYEKALGWDHTSTLSTVNNLGILYKDQGSQRWRSWPPSTNNMKLSTCHCNPASSLTPCYRKANRTKTSSPDLTRWLQSEGKHPSRRSKPCDERSHRKSRRSWRLATERAHKDDFTEWSALCHTSLPTSINKSTFRT